VERIKKQAIAKVEHRFFETALKQHSSDIKNMGISSHAVYGKLQKIATNRLLTGTFDVPSPL
jgi:hypothetical protein